MTAILPALVGVGVVALTMPLVIRILVARGVYDVPNARSSHSVVIPRGGGVAVVIATVAASVIAGWGGQLATPAAGVFGLTMIGFAALGLVDDLLGLSAIVRLAVQLVGGIAVTYVLLGFPSVPASTPWVILGLGAIWLAAFVNAFNFMDGINAISGVSAALSATWYGLWATSVGDAAVATWAWALMGASLGFLPWNAPSARVFLGDVGSYGMGALLGTLALATWSRTGSVAVASAPLLVYLADTAGTLAVRAWRREPLLQAHRSHVYQRLTAAGLTHIGSTTVVGAFTLACCAVVAAGGRWMPMLLCAVLAVYLLLPAALSRRARAAA